MEILVIYASVEGQTRKIADWIAGLIKDEGHGARVYDTENAKSPLSFNGIDKVVLAAPVHERRHPKSFESLIKSVGDKLDALPTMLISVSLKAAFPEGMEEARDYLTEMEMRTGFRPDVEELAAGAVRSSSYGYYESQIVQYVALDGREVDLVDGVREFTDWDRIHSHLTRFMRAAPKA